MTTMTIEDYFTASDPGVAAALMAKATVLYCRTCGMVAENQRRQDQGHALAYTADNFDADLDMLFPGLPQLLNTGGAAEPKEEP